MKATAKAPANIAFIKYWGKVDPVSRAPQNNSISMNLSDLYSICTVEFDSQLFEDEIHFLDEKTVTEKEKIRIIQTLDRIRNLKNIQTKAKIVTQNNFPKATGIASSASGFAALTVAAVTALGLKLNNVELSKLARFASGTASRSIPDGFVEWEKGTDAEDSYARQFFPSNYWDICDVVAIVTTQMKKVSSTDGHALAFTSPFYRTRLIGMDQKIYKIKKLIQNRNFSEFGELIEAETLNMHAVCITSRPALIYWEPTTIEIMKKIVDWREKSEVEAYYTIDAGPTVHVICEAKNAEKVKQKLITISRVEHVVINKPAIGARITQNHLF